MNPADGYYAIPTTHTNYVSLRTLVELAVSHGFTVSTRTKEVPDAQSHAEVTYLIAERGG